jgi:hypothetical protein
LLSGLRLEAGKWARCGLPVEARVVRRRTAVATSAVATVAAVVVLSLIRDGRAGSPPLPLASLATLSPMRASGPAGPVGPEGVPIPTGKALARPRSVVAGRRIDGIACQTSEQVLFHIHAHLVIVVRGVAQQVPAGIGIAPPYQVASTARGAFIAGASCFMWLHTHAADGLIHTESPIARTYTLGDFFDIWGQPLDRRQVGPAHGRVTALFDGRVFTGDPREIPLLAHAQIELEVGRPLLAPERIAFPVGL